ncbi:hypothetical protein DY000_02024109 [Brassica cretica]|uniref:Uncharacterized protein n=1 Tax=Brassica cretica TaxID=69181 RepID=A0ABQ7EKH9_BRACR|nr:hypothetical protein DY000_02024109 [Brassica cretica]
MLTATPSCSLVFPSTCFLGESSAIPLISLICSASKPTAPTPSWMLRLTTFPMSWVPSRSGTFLTDDSTMFGIPTSIAVRKSNTCPTSLVLSIERTRAFSNLKHDLCATGSRDSSSKVFHILISLILLSSGYKSSSLQTPQGPQWICEAQTPEVPMVLREA